MLAEFGSAQDAVRCAIDIQTAMTERESATPIDSRITYRVGINLGDVVVDEGDIYGDGVNVASRLHGLAKPSPMPQSSRGLRSSGSPRAAPSRSATPSRTRSG